MNVYEIMRDHASTLLGCVADKRKAIATELLRSLLVKTFEEGYNAGIVDALSNFEKAKERA
jgi:hypothetical protein